MRRVLAAVAFAAAGCAGSSGALRPMTLSAPSELARCKVAASQTSPLVTEWPASEKSNLEAMLREGAVAVAHSGCTMRVLTQCRLRGAYVWQRTTPSTDELEIENADDLYAKLPLGAASLEGELKRSGKIAVRSFVSGQMKLQGATAADVPADGECAAATHVVGALAVGAFELSTGGEVSGRAGGSLAGVAEAGGSVTRGQKLLRSAGSPVACNSSTQEAPHPDCRSPIQVFLWPLPGRAASDGPPGTVKVDFVSAAANSRWDVYADDQVICTTPCSKWVNPDRPVLFRAREERFMAAPDRVQLGDLRNHAGAGALQIQAHPTAQGELVTGITFTSLGGMGVLAGVTLTALGCAGDHDGLCHGGLVTLGAGALVTAGAIWLIVDSLPHARVRSLDQALIVGPGFVAGRF